MLASTGTTAVVMLLYHHQARTLKPALDPDCRSDSMFPGSRYAMLMRNPGPVKAQSFRKLKAYQGTETEAPLHNSTISPNVGASGALWGKVGVGSIALVDMPKRAKSSIFRER